MPARRPVARGPIAWTPFLFIFPVLVLLLAACTTGDGETGSGSATGVEASGDTGREGETADQAGTAGGPIDYDTEPVDSALRGNRANSDFPTPAIDPALIRSGGVPPDGIPPIDDPVFLTADQVDFLSDDEAVIVVEVGGEAKAYPIQILIWHEIVNDTFGDIPVAVTYCPLCNSALAFDRRFGDRVLDFGTSGELYQSALVMYDRQTESLWAHFTGQGLVGHYAGASLDFIPAQTVSWSQFRGAHPAGEVLSRTTGAGRPYGDNPYPSYDREDTDPIGSFFDGDIDRTLAAKARVVGIADDEGSVAVRFEDLEDRSVIAVTGDDRNLVVFHQPGLASALESFQIDGGRDIGQTGVFIPTADGTELTFGPVGDAADGRFQDEETGSSWNILGQAVDGPLAGQELRAVPHVDTFWFAWATYRPGTVIVDPPA